MASRAEIIAYVLSEHGVDISEWADYGQVDKDRARTFLAITVCELARVILDNQVAGIEQAGYLSDRAPHAWAHDSEYLMSKTLTLASLSAEIRMAREALRTAVQGLKERN